MSACHAAHYAARNPNAQRLAGYAVLHVRHLTHQTQSSGAAHKTLLLLSKGFFLSYALRFGLYLELLGEDSGDYPHLTAEPAETEEIESRAFLCALSALCAKGL